MKKLLKVVIIIFILIIYPVEAKILNTNNFIDTYHLERVYVVDRYAFDLSNGFNPSLKDLLIAASYNTNNNISVYEIKITKNINHDLVHEYSELLDENELDEFPRIDVKYIYDKSISKDNSSYLDIDDSIQLVYGKSNAKVLTEEEFNELGISHAYVIGDYLFNLDDGFNPSLKDLLLAAKTTYTDDINVYEIKSSENIDGDLIVEYNELLSNQKLDTFPIIKVKYIYSNNIYGNDALLVLPYYDGISLSDVVKTYTAETVVVDEAVSENELPIVYEFYNNTDCSGEKLVDGAVDVGEYGVLAKSIGTDQYLSGSICKKLTVVPKDITTSSQVNFTGAIYTYTGSAIEPTFTVVENGITLVKDKDYTFTYSDNVNAGNGKIHLTFIGNYKGNKTQEFSIQKRNIELYASNHERVYDDTIFETNEVSYCNVRDNTPLGNGDVISACHLVADSVLVGGHYTVIDSYVISKDGVNVNDNYNVTLTKGILTTTKRTTVCTINPKNKVYDGTPLVLYSECSNLVSGHKGASTKVLPTLINVADSTIFSIERTEVKITKGEVNVTDNYNIEISNGGLIPLAILAKDGEENNNMVITLEYDSVIGDGTAKEPRIIKIHDNDLNVDLVENESYTYSYFNNHYQGTAEVRVEFKGNYKGYRTVTFLIQ